MYEGYLLLGILLLLTIVVLELWNPSLINEGFANVVKTVSVGNGMWSKWMPRRGDVGPDPTGEHEGYIRDIRYFAGYTDVQRLGQDHDFCRMLQSVSDPKELSPTGKLPGGQRPPVDMFFACALGGTDGLSTVLYKTPSTKDGFELSRDDYMNDVLKEGRSGYCRILKTGTDQFEAKCNPASDSVFKAKLITDSNPPPEIQTMLSFYEGIVFWLRLRDDLLDYAKNLTISTAGSMEIDEVPSDKTEGLAFNGQDQFLRIGDTPDLSFGDVVQLRYVRAFSFWVYFEEFTNNAKIFDFGESGQPSVFVGIIGRGNPQAQQDVVEPTMLDESQKTIPHGPSGAQCVLEQSPQKAMATSRGNIENYDCPMPEIFGRIMDPLYKKAAPVGDVTNADMLYEVWDTRMRKLHIQVKNVIPLKKWVHIAITATSMDAMKPDLKIYVDGKMVHTEAGACLPQTNYTSSNYIGKSNTANATSQMDNKDELFKGKLFDFRGYRTPMTDKKIGDTVKWGKTLLGLDVVEEE